jgi:hypothetical protein
MPAVHDRGGWPTDEPIDRTEHERSYWERSTHALRGALAEMRLLVTDEVRRGIESLSLDEYESLSYYEQWSASIETLLVEKNVLTEEEIDAKVRELF